MGPTSCTLAGNRSSFFNSGYYGQSYNIGYGTGMGNRYNSYRYGNAMKNNQILNEMKVGISWRGCSNGERFIRKFNKVIGETMKNKQKEKKTKRDSKNSKKSSKKKSSGMKGGRKAGRGSKKVRRNFFKSMDKNKNGILE